MADVPELWKTFKECCVESKNFCMICFRTEDQRILTKSKYIPRFTKVFSPVDNYWCTDNNTNFLVCYMCEHQAWMAHKFVTMFNRAKRVTEFYNEMRTDKRFRSEVKQYLVKGYETFGRKEQVSDKLKEDLKVLRKQSTLVRTDVLVINHSQDGDIEPAQEVQPMTKESDEVMILPDMVPKIEIKEEKDDETKGSDGKDETKNPFAEYFLHPIIEQNGHFRVPSLKACIKDGYIYYAKDFLAEKEVPCIAYEVAEGAHIVTDHKEILDIFKNINKYPNIYVAVHNEKNKCEKCDKPMGFDGNCSNVGPDGKCAGKSVQVKVGKVGSDNKSITNLRSVGKSIRVGSVGKSVSSVGSDGKCAGKNVDGKVGNKVGSDKKNVTNVGSVGKSVSSVGSDGKSDSNVTFIKEKVNNIVNSVGTNGVVLQNADHSLWVAGNLIQTVGNSLWLNGILVPSIKNSIGLTNNLVQNNNILALGGNLVPNVNNGIGLAGNIPNVGKNLMLNGNLLPNVGNSLGAVGNSVGAVGNRRGAVGNSLGTAGIRLAPKLNSFSPVGNSMVAVGTCMGIGNSLRPDNLVNIVGNSGITIELDDSPVNSWADNIQLEVVKTEKDPLAIQQEMETIDIDSDNRLSDNPIDWDNRLSDNPCGVEKRKSKRSSIEIVKEPVKKSCKIDWEDKIPMDVISCVEPSDPIIMK